MLKNFKPAAKSSYEGTDLLDLLGDARHVKSLWVLILVNIAAVALLAAGLVLISNEPAYLILSLGLTVCAVTVIAVAGYSSWYLFNLNKQVRMLIEGINNSERGVMLTNAEGIIQFYNVSLSKHFGNLSDMPIDTFLSTYVHPEGRAEFARLRQDAQNGVKSSGVVLIGDPQATPDSWYVRVTPAQKGEGSIYWLLESDSPELESPGKKQLNANFRSVFEDAPMGIVVLDRECRIRASNRQFRHKLFKGTVKVQTPFQDILHESCKEAIQDSLQRVLAGEDVSMPLEIRFESDHLAHVSLFANQIQNKASPEGQTSGLILHFFDNSEQKKLHLQLAQSQKMQAMGQLAGGIAHDFNNLLTASIGFCDLLLLRHSPGDRSFTDIMQIKQNSNRAANLVRQLLAFSKQQTLKPQMLNISEVLSETSVLLQRLVGMNVELDIVHGRSLGLIKVDKGQLEQVIINLVVNARDAMNDKGIIKISTMKEIFKKDQEVHHDVIPKGEYVVLSVEDDGHGISKENISRIFDPFFSTKELGSGTGLGLSTVYGIVQQTGGNVLVESEVGKGTTFKIVFPYHDPEKVGKDSEAQKRKAISGDLTGTATVLLVEDEDAVRLFGARALRDKGYKVIEARDGEEALNYLQSAQEDPAKMVDLMVTDVVMPVMDGVELVKKVHEFLPDLKIIFISGYAEDSFRQKVGEEEGIEFLPKPFSLKELALKVKTVLGPEDEVD